MKLHWFAAVLVMLIAGPALGAAPDTREARQALVDEYFKLIPMTKMVDEMTAEVAKQVPEASRKEFIQIMTKHYRMSVIEAAARESMARHLTVAELTLFVEFIKKPEGRSAMEKMKYYVADLMPVIQQEVVRAIELTKAEQ